MYLFVDDMRNVESYILPPPEEWTIARNYDEAIRHLETGKVEILSLNHDLGLESGTGYDIACWLERAVLSGQIPLPPDIRIHSANPVGAKNIQRVLDAIERHMGAG